jgi:hypothetical protein
MSHHTSAGSPSPGYGSANDALSHPSPHPVGLLYTLLRHGRGLSHEEADRVSGEFICGPTCRCQPPKAA